MSFSPKQIQQNTRETTEKETLIVLFQDFWFRQTETEYPKHFQKFAG